MRVVTKIAHEDYAHRCKGDELDDLISAALVEWCRIIASKSGRKPHNPIGLASVYAGWACWNAYKAMTGYRSDCPSTRFHVTPLTLEYAEHCPAAVTDPADQLAEAEERANLARAVRTGLGRLSAGQRQAVAMFYGLGRQQIESESERAAACGHSVGTHSSNVSRGRRRLRAYLIGRGYGPIMEGAA
jgi:DNA-directed RNA polymerase specialized sigma24 family protein